jgi:two-component system, LytTR family, sensor kinase
MIFNRTFIRTHARLIVLVWAGASVFFTALLEISELGHKPLGFALYSNAVHFALWALTLPFLTKFIQRFPLKEPKRIRNAGIRLILVAVLALLVTVAHWAIIFSTYFPYSSDYPTIKAFLIFLKSELPRFLPNEVLIGIVLVTAIEAWQVLLALQTERMRAMELERQLAVSRLEALRMQLHPHFLFNTLHTIAGLIVEQPPSARRMVIALAELLRLTLKDTGRPMRSLAEELEFADLYLGIEKLRLGDRLVIDYDLEPEATRAEVPQLLLQPLFENAVRHGAARITGSCEVRFSAHREREWLRLMISNDGPLHTRASTSSQSGVGLSNTKDRLRLHYKDSFTFQYTERPQGGVQIDISVPYKGTEEKKTDRVAPALRSENFGDSEIDLASDEIPADRRVFHSEI